MADKKISALTAATTPLAGTEVLPIVQSGSTVKVSVDNLTTGKPVTVGSLTNAGNLNFTGTGNRITGDFSNATVANRVLFQTNGTNTFTQVGVVPSGTGTYSVINTYTSSDPTNSSFGSLLALNNVDVRFSSGILGTGIYLPMTFYTGGSKRVEIATSGDVSVSTGNLVIGTAGKGIDFSADPSAAGMTSELLDDYEEGTWTPTITGSGSNPTVTYGLQRAIYTKVGRLVNVTCFLSWTAISGGSGDARISGLPFTIEGNPGAAGAGAISELAGFTLAASRTSVSMYAASANTFLNVRCMGSGVSTVTIAIADLAASGSLNFTVTYAV